MLLGVLSRTERELVVSVLWQWAETTPDLPVAGFLDGERLLTPMELAAAAERGTADGEALLEILEHGLRREGIDSVVRRFTAYDNPSYEDRPSYEDH
jgi:hypothetical protein